MTRTTRSTMINYTYMSTRKKTPTTCKKKEPLITYNDIIQAITYLLSLATDWNNIPNDPLWYIVKVSLILIFVGLYLRKNARLSSFVIGGITLVYWCLFAICALLSAIFVVYHGTMLYICVVIY